MLLDFWVVEKKVISGGVVVGYPQSVVSRER